MSHIEKGLTIVALASMGLIIGYSFLKPHGMRGLSTSEIIEKRKELLKNPNIKVLYSSMSFFYLQSYTKQASDLILLKEVLDVTVMNKCVFIIETKNCSHLIV
jgi:hypothetical protein